MAERPSLDRQAWLAQVTEPILDPDQPIVDPHHHLFDRPGLSYLVDDLVADTSSGHNVVATVYMECGTAYLDDGPEHLRPVGETAYVAAVASRHAGGPVAGIVAHADLRLDALDDVLDAHLAASSLFRGIRHAGSRDDDPALVIPGGAPEGLYADDAFRRGVARLGARGFTYDTWHYHHQNRAYLDLARAVPDTQLVLDHFGTPLGVGRYAGRSDEIFEQWRTDVAEIATCENVVAKLGGMAMPDNGYGWHLAERPPTSDEFVAVQGRWYEHMLDCFGADRCMFESNFPVDKWSISYPVLWNAFKKIAAGASATERAALFHDTAARVYRLAR